MSDDIISLNISISSNEAIKRLDDLQKTIRGREIMKRVGDFVVEKSKDRIFYRENKAPDGSAWESLAASTIKHKIAAKKDHQGMLMHEGDLWKRIVHQNVTEDSVTIGSSMLYARIHQKGGMAGRGRKVRIPARPYLGLTEDQKKLLEEKVTLWIKKLIGV